MFIQLFFMLVSQAASPEATTMDDSDLFVGEPTSQTSVVSPNVDVQKEVIYQKEQTVNFEGSKVEGENQLPPAFFVTKMQTPGARSLLQERLRFGLRDYNHMGF